MTTRWTKSGAVRYWLLLISLLIAAAAVSGSAPVDASGRSGREIPAHIVLLEAGAVPGDVARNHGLDIRARFGSAINGFATTVPAGRMRSLLRDPDVAAVEPNLVLQAGPVSSGSSITVSSQSIPAGIKRIGADLSKIANIDGIDDRVPVVVAVLDTGVDGSHPDLNVNVARSVDCSSGVACVSGLAVDDNGHGTHVAGIIGALDNAIGVVGVAPGAEIWSIRVCASNGSCGLDAILLGHDYISNNADQIDVVNVSLGGLGWSVSWRNAISSNVDLGIPVYVAAGNGNRDIYGYDGTIGNGNEFIPATYPEAAAVSAMVDTDGASGGAGTGTTHGMDDSLADFSNYALSVVAGNPVAGSGGAIDMAAPGVSVLSTVPGGQYAYMTGTSMASPHAAGLAALRIAATAAPADAAGVAALRQILIDDAAPMADWRTDSADVGSDQDDYHEPLGTADPLIEPGPADPPASVTDVAVAGVDAAAIVIQGDLLRIEVVLANLGDSDAVSDVVITDATSGQVIHSGSVNVPVGSSQTLPVLWDTSTATVGQHSISAEVTTIADIDPTNDNGFVTIMVEAPVTDLAIVSVITLSSAVVGDPLRIDVAVENLGNRTVSGATVSIMSDNATPDAAADDFVVAVQPLPEALYPGELSTFSVIWDTVDAVAGTHVLRARHSISGDVPANDIALIATTLEAAVRDLAVTGFTVPANILVGDTLLFEIVVQNVGTIDFGSGIEVVVTSDNGTPEISADDFVVTVQALPGITAGSGTSFGYPWNTTGVAPGVHTLTARLSVSDDDPSNNAISASSTLGMAVTDLAVAAFTVPANTIVGVTSLLEVTVDNIGTIDIGSGVEVTITSDNGTPEISADDFVVTVQALPGIAAGSGTSFGYPWDTTGVAPGVHTLTARHGLSDSSSVNNARTASAELSAPPPPAPAPEPIQVVVETDRSTYSSRDTVRITVVTTEPDGSPAVRADLTLKISSPTGWSKVVTTTTGRKGVKTFKLKLNANRMGCGVYTVEADVYLAGFPSGFNKTTFRVC